MRLPLLLLAALMACSACRKPPAARHGEPRFAIEMPALGSAEGGPPSHVVVREDALNDSRIPLSSLPETSWRARTMDPPETLKLQYSAEGEKVRIVTYAISKEYDYHRRVTVTNQRKLGAHTARLNESVKLAELQEIGHAPFTVKVVSAKPPPRPYPPVIGKVPSLAAEFTGQDWDGYTLTVRNVSNRVIRGWAYGVGGDASPVTDHFRPGEIRTPSVSESVVRQTLADRTTRFGPVVIRCALFEDRSWEGDAAEAMILRAMVIGLDTERQRIAKIVEPILRDNALDDQAKRERVRSQVSGLPDEPDSTMIRAVLDGLPFARLDSSNEELLRLEMRIAKDGLLRRLGQPHVTLADLWRQIGRERQ